VARSRARIAARLKRRTTVAIVCSESRAISVKNRCLEVAMRTWNWCHVMAIERHLRQLVRLKGGAILFRDESVVGRSS
jgi:hypothetical protein